MKATIKRYWKFLLVILAALAIGVLGGAVAHKLGYFSAVKALLLSPVAQQEPADMSQETEPLGSVFDRSSMQVLHFTDETATEFVPVLEADRESLSQRYELPPLERMNETDTAELMAPRQVLRKPTGKICTIRSCHRYSLWPRPPARPLSLRAALPGT